MSDPKATVRAMERMTKETQFQLRISSELITLAKQVATDDGLSLSAWIRALISLELKRRGVLK